jgi:GAF domain-containing protein
VAQPAEQKFSPQQQTALDNLTQALARATGRAELIDAFMAQLQSVAPFETCALTLAAPESGDYTVAHACGEHGALLSGRNIVPGEGVTGWVLVNNKSFYNADPKLDVPATLAANFAAYRTLAACPLMQANEVHGVVTLYAATLKEYGAAEQGALEEAARLFAAALAGRAQLGYGQTPMSLTGVALQSDLTH